MCHHPWIRKDRRVGMNDAVIAVAIGISVGTWLAHHFVVALRGRSGSVFTVGFRVVRVVPMTLGAGKTNGGGSRQIISSAAPSPIEEARVNAQQPVLLVPDRDSPPLAVAPFDARQAHAHQEAWARHLGVPVEQTNSLGMKLILIPPGVFAMGSTPEEIEKGAKLAREQEISPDVVAMLEGGHP